MLRAPLSDFHLFSDTLHFLPGNVVKVGVVPEKKLVASQVGR